MKRLLSLCAILLTLVGWRGSVVQAQSGEGWTPPIDLFANFIPDVQGYWRYPVITSDPAGGLHVFWCERIDENAPGWAQVIYYVHWDGTSWSQPVDLLISPSDPEAAWPRAAADENGKLHLVWKGQFGLYYSWAPAYGAASVRAWAPPRRIFPGKLTASGSDIVVDQHGGLHVACAEMEGIYYLKSTDGGTTWSEPIEVSHPVKLDVYDNMVRLAVDGKGRIHVAWNQGGPGGFGDSVWYARSVDNGRGWSEPITIARADEPKTLLSWINVAAIGEDTIHLVWNDKSPPQRYHQWSADGGQTWTTPTRFFPKLVGETGFSATAVDSAGVLHVVTGAHGGGHPDNVFHSSWDGVTWSDPAPVGNDDTGCHHPDIVVSEGNKLNVVWIVGGAWYATKRVPAPHVPPRPLPTIPPTPTATPAMTPVPSSTLTPRSRAGLSSIETTSGFDEDVRSSPWYPLVAGVLPVVLILSVVVLIRTMPPGRR